MIGCVWKKCWHLQESARDKGREEKDDSESSVWDMLDRRLLCRGTYNPEDEDEKEEPGEATPWLVRGAAIAIGAESMLSSLVRRGQWCARRTYRHEGDN